MQALLRKMREERENGDRGFTMIELLVVVVIIGVLVAIAIPLYLNYRKGAENKSAESDVRGAISAVEQFYTDNANNFPDDQTSGSGTNMTLTSVKATVPSPAQTQSVSVSPGNVIGFDDKGAYYVICGRNDNGQTTYVYNSQTGGSVKKSTQATVPLCLTSGT